MSDLFFIFPRVLHMGIVNISLMLDTIVLTRYVSLIH